jgi:hypothetical protein
MSDHGEVEVENPSGAFQALPKDALAEMGSVKLFNKWSYEDVEIRDISLTYVFDSKIPATQTCCERKFNLVGLGSNFDGRHTTRSRMEISAHTKLGIYALDSIEVDRRKFADSAS